MIGSASSQNSFSEGNKQESWGNIYSQSKLPSCKGEQSQWTNCFGVSKFGYSGEYKDGVRHGNGSYASPSTGQTYIGQFKDGKYNGLGTLYDLNRNIVNSGIWIDGNFSQSASVQQLPKSNTVLDKVPRDLEQAKIKLTELQDPTEACLSNLPSQKELQVLKGKVVLGVEPQSLEILSNTKKPNQLEKNALLALDRLIDQCKSQGKDWRVRNYPSSLNSIIDSTFFSNYKFLLSDLYAGKLTYGDFARKRQELGTEFNIAISNENSRLQKNVEIENSNLQREQQRKKGELEQQILYQKQQECRTTNQQILEAVRALNQAKAQQQAFEQMQAQRRAAEFGTPQGLYNSASQFGNAIGLALGAEDPLQVQDRRIQEAIQQYKFACER